MNKYFLHFLLLFIHNRQVSVICNISTNHTCNSYKIEKVVNVLNSLQARSVYFIHDADVLDSALLAHNWPSFIKLSTYHLSNGGNTSTVSPQQHFDVLVVLLKHSDKWIKFLTAKIFSPPFVIEKKTVLFVIDVDGLQIQMSPRVEVKLQNFIIWRQNKIYFLLHDKNSKCNIFNLHMIQYRTMMRDIEKRTLDIHFHTYETKIIPLQKTNMSVGINPFSPDAIVVKDSNGTKTFTGFVYELLVDYLFPMMNLKIIEVYGNQIEPPGENFGIMNMIIEKKLNTSTTAFIMTPPRVNDFDWVSLPMKYDYLGLAVRQSFETNEFDFLAFTQPFTLTSWVIIAVFTVVFSKLDDIVQKHSLSKKTLSFTRSFLFFWLTFAFYNAVIYAYLTTITSTNPYNSLHDVLEDKRFKFYAHARFDLPVILKSAKTKKFVQLRQRLESSDNQGKVENFEDAYNLVLKVNQYNAFLHFLNLMKHDVKQDCRYHFIKINYEISVPLTFGKGSRFVDMFSQNQIWVKESGLLTKLEDRYLPHKICSDNHYLTKPISIYITISLFVFLLCGVCASLFALFLEFSYSKGTYKRPSGSP